jgi:glycosyltransferase involved in cell wall biosynthesis
MRKRGLLTPNIKLLGIIDAEQIINEMLNAGLFVYPSAIENSSNAVQEAKLLGIPILCTYAGGMSSIITHNVTGILISEGDPYSMAGAILEMFHDYQHSAELGRNARISALKENDPNIVIKQLLEAYSNILKQDIIE